MSFFTRLTLTRDQAILLRLLLEKMRESAEKRALNSSAIRRTAAELMVDQIDAILKQLPVMK